MPYRSNVRTRNRKRARTASKRSRRSKRKIKIIDPPFSRSFSKGTLASIGCCSIDPEEGYHYQNYENISVFLKTIRENNPSMKQHIYLFPQKKEAFLEYGIQTDKLTVLEMSYEDFKKDLLKGVYKHTAQFVPIILNLSLTDSENHANILVVNKKTKIIELFEPHGARTSSSELGGIHSVYKKKKRALNKFFKKILPDYTIVNVVEAVRKTAFQMTDDPRGHSGFCVTWSILYAHYRFLNPDVNLSLLIRYIHKKINSHYILRYAKYIETLVKNENRRKFDKHLKK